MGTTTTIRVDRAVHERLLQIGRDSGQQLVEVLSDATEALERAHFAKKVLIELDALRSDPESWNSYVGDFDLAASDGLA
jgi:predicted transcriptional regulator